MSTSVARARPDRASSEALDGLIVEHVRAVVEHRRADRAWYVARFEELAQAQEQKGFRLVDGGQVGADSGDGCAPYAITDHRTGEVLLQGYGTYEDLDKQWGADWWHVDAIDPWEDAQGPPEPVTPGLPEGLQGALGDWAERFPNEAEQWLATQ